MLLEAPRPYSVAAPMGSALAMCGSIGVDATDTQGVRGEILNLLRTPPYHFIAYSPNVAMTADDVGSLISPLALTQRLSFTRVRIDPEEAARPSRATRYSRTNLSLPLHTDSAHTKRPHSLVAFLAVRPDASGGGQSSIIPVKEVIAQLNPATIAALRRPVFNFGRGLVPILSGPTDDPSIRYYRTQIDSCTQVLDDRSLTDVLAPLDEVLLSLAAARTFSLKTGDLLIVNNHKALHARTGFDENSERLVLRFRLRVREIE